MALRSVNPATGEEIERFDEHTKKEVDAALERSARAFRPWRSKGVEDRARTLEAAADLLRGRSRRYGEVITREMGKPIREAIAEVEKCAWLCDYYAEHGASFLAAEEVATDAKRSYVRYDPLGPVLAVMPWNFPFWQVVRFAAPALLAGNVGLLKHASNVPRCSVTIEEVFHEAGVPKGAFQSLLLPGKAIAGIVRDPRVRAVTLTGSEKAGASVAEAAGASIKKTVLELGGSDPFVVLADADVDPAARVAAEARCINAGQSCIAAKRFVVVKDVHPAFLERFREEMAALKVGDPMREETQVGPLARREFLEDLDRQVRGSTAKGAKVEIGGTRIEGPGFYYAPTILSGVKPGMPAYDEEVFGPVAGVVRARDEADAIRIANDSKYGLGASVWTEDIERGMRLAAEIDAGMVFVNRLVKSDPCLPFGGVKASGYGRELGPWGIREFVNAKTVWVEA